jgi:hypothetical protein
MMYPKGSVYITTDQPLGDLAMVLLEPLSKDSFRWGFPLYFSKNRVYRTICYGADGYQNAARVT